jgi:hypothetical protein
MNGVDMSSYQRTRRLFFDYAKCNTFRLFVTFTFDPKKHPDCYDYDYSLKKVVRFLNNTKTKYGNFEHLMVAEQTKDGKWHFHALLTGFTGPMHEVPLSVSQKAKRTRYNWPDELYRHYKIDVWEQSNGFADAETIVPSHHDQVVGYAAKYVAKDIDTASIHDKNRKRYFSSQGLNKPTKLYNETLDTLQRAVPYDTNKIETIETDWTNQYTMPRLPVGDSGAHQPTTTLKTA